MIYYYVKNKDNYLKDNWTVPLKNIRIAFDKTEFIQEYSNQHTRYQKETLLYYLN